MFSWRLPASNRADVEHLIKPAIEARRRVREAAWHWREGPSEAAMKALLAAQLQYCRALERTGAKNCKDWDELLKLFKVGPSDEATAIDQARTWFIALLKKHPQYPPRPVEELIQEAIRKFTIRNSTGRSIPLSKPRARQAYRDAQNRIPNHKWSEARRPSRNILQARAEQTKLENASFS